MESSVHVSGELVPWPSKQRLEAILREAGLNIVVGQYSIRVEDCDHFTFQQLGGDGFPPVVEADADSFERMMCDCALVSNALKNAGVRHRFEIYNDENDLMESVHHEWSSGT